VREVSDVRDMLYIAIRRNEELAIPLGNISQPDDVIAVFSKKEAGSERQIRSFTENGAISLIIKKK
jgi:hypothetical protein